MCTNAIISLMGSNFLPLEKNNTKYIKRGKKKKKYNILDYFNYFPKVISLESINL